MTNTNARDVLSSRIQLLCFMFDETDGHSLDPAWLQEARKHIDQAVNCIEESVTDRR